MDVTKLVGPDGETRKCQPLLVYFSPRERRQTRNSEGNSERK